jgi:pimeloyl-ACP methyl ester carboxylesterase
MQQGTQQQDLGRTAIRRLRGASGLELVVEVQGSGAPLVLLHGGGQTRHAWRNAAGRIAAAGWHTLAVDQRGHGESEWAQAAADYRLECYAEDLAAVLASLSAPAVVVGASLGGLAGLLVAGELAPGLCRALVLVDIVVKPEADGIERILGFMESHGAGFADLQEAADAVAAYLPHRRRGVSHSGLARNLRRRDDGRYYWHWDPRLLESARETPLTHWEPRLRGAARALHQPTLLVRGALSDVLSDVAVEDFLVMAPHARCTNVGEAAHMVAGERNDVFADAVLAFLAEMDPGR